MNYARKRTTSKSNQSKAAETKTEANQSKPTEKKAEGKVLQGLGGWVFWVLEKTQKNTAVRNLAVFLTHSPYLPANPKKSKFPWAKNESSKVCPRCTMACHASRDQPRPMRMLRGSNHPRTDNQAILLTIVSPASMAKKIKEFAC
ncbi:MAG: hypothetical protein NXI32_14475 [bacterium]|nr:hypothetical protein [bacterium]